MKTGKTTTALRALGTAAAALALVTGVQAPSASAQDLGGNAYKNLHSGRYLEVGGWSTANGALVNQWDYHGGSNQGWASTGSWVNGRWWGIEKNANSGKCLEVADWSTTNGATVRQWDCHGGANQQWDEHYISDDVFYLINRHSGKCLEIGGWSTVNGARAQQWDCTGGTNQMWTAQSRG
ncbi:RICIN domain-containing protein [Streptomyces sp. NBC_00250]|uniref:RICIN domain-containing protein n=1 Tax=Streptomyces sp. NBC_00250 TaxID=2903641 RepID=UPI002E2BCEB0|nr:RICIN domain-containing protein [Streptomyces sp. NBC_00250]